MPINMTGGATGAIDRGAGGPSPRAAAGAHLAQPQSHGTLSCLGPAHGVSSPTRSICVAERPTEADLLAAIQAQAA
jgi:hypothetical protein